MSSGTLHQLPLGDSGLLTLGAKGEAVTALQRSLNTLRVTFIAIPEDGVFTIDTANAVKAFQARAGLPTTGAVDSATREKLTDAVGQLRPSAALAASPAMMMEAPVAPAKPKLPLWQAGLMALGAISLIGGAFWMLTKEDEPKKPTALPTTEPTALAGHVKELKKPTKTKCPKPPSSHEAGEPISA